MGLTIAQKIIKEHLISGEMTVGSEVALRIDQTLTQDATGTMAYLEFETMGVPRVKTELSVAYIDHNTLQSGFENADDHRFIQSMAKKHGLYFSRPGNGICHQVHLERFGKPGKTLIGSDSHTPTGGGIGMLAMGAGGLDVAVAMGVSMLGAMEHAGEAQGMLGKMVMDAMEDLIAETADLKQKDNKLADKINRVSEKADELAKELGRKVTVEELVAEGQISKKAALDAIRISGNKIENLTAEGEM